MSVFDTIRSRYPLPVNVPEGTVFQTKSFPNPYQDQYEIREDGTLWVWDCWPIGEHKKDWQACIFTGSLFMYTDLNGGWLEIRVEFENGCVIGMKVEEYERPNS